MIYLFSYKDFHIISLFSSLFSTISSKFVWRCCRILGIMCRGRGWLLARVFIVFCAIQLRSMDSSFSSILLLWLPGLSYLLILLLHISTNRMMTFIRVSLSRILAIFLFSVLLWLEPFHRWKTWWIKDTTLQL